MDITYKHVIYGLTTTNGKPNSCGVFSLYDPFPNISILSEDMTRMPYGTVITRTRAHIKSTCVAKTRIEYLTLEILSIQGRVLLNVKTH